MNRNLTSDEQLTEKITKTNKALLKGLSILICQFLKKMVCGIKFEMSVNFM
jgi:hypothetical protein